PVPLSYIRDEARHGRMTPQLMAVVSAGDRGRIYLAASDDQEDVALGVAAPDDAPDTPLPDQALGFRVQAYGMTRHRDLFTNRQLVTLCTLSNLTTAVRAQVEADGGTDVRAAAVSTYL